jgi:hypothetical protein
VNAQSPLRICLYVAVSSDAEYRLIPTPAVKRMKRAIGRGLDLANWFLRGSARVRLHHWNTRDITNKGDIAIRESIKEQLRAAFTPRDVVFSELAWGTLDPLQADAISREHELFVIAGSGYIFSHETGALAPRSAQDHVFIEALTCPKIAYGIGWNKLMSTADLHEDRPLTQGSRDTLKGILDGLDLVSVRDRATQELVRDITGRDPTLTGDPALFYRGAGPAPKRFKDGKLHVGLNFALHSKELIERIERQHEPFCEFLREFARRHDVMYHYVEHVETERVLPLLLRAQGIRAERVDIPPSHLPNFYATLDLHICQMLHSAILAVDAGVPTLHFAYDVKSVGFFDLMQMPEYCFPGWPFDPQQGLAVLEALHANATKVKEHIARRKGEIAVVRDAFLNEIRAVVAKGQG